MECNLLIETHDVVSSLFALVLNSRRFDNAKNGRGRTAHLILSLFLVNWNCPIGCFDVLKKERKEKKLKK